MSVISILNEELKRVKIVPDEKKDLNNLSLKVIEAINERLKRKYIEASVFIGGSIAKETILRKESQDIDIFIRFNKKYSEEDIVKNMKRIFFFFNIKGFKTRVTKIHGSRDYFQIKLKSMPNINIEVIPTVKVTGSEEARNITDLSYFHVSYIKNRFSKNKKLADEVILAKAFCHAQKCYGAESYIKGFSGYALELLICYYGSFLKFLKEIVKADRQIIIDLEKHYKSKNDAFSSLNKAKKESPIILIDPTFKERNTAASLSYDTFYKFRDAAKKFLENPSSEFFEQKIINENELKRKAKETDSFFNSIEIISNKQPGDIAGTKMLKFSKILIKYIEDYFIISDQEFDYSGDKRAYIYLIYKKKKEIILTGPSIKLNEAVKNFKKVHPIWYIEDEKIKCTKKPEDNIKKLIKIFRKKNRNLMKEMGIKKIKAH